MKDINMTYLTKQQLIDRINVWMKYDLYAQKVLNLLNIEQASNEVIDLEWYYRNDLINSIILKEMAQNKEYNNIVIDEIESFEMYEVFDDLINEAEEKNYNAEWVYNELIKEWYNNLQEVMEQVLEELKA